MKEHGLFIDGEYRPAASGATYPSIDPATGEPWALFAAAGVEDVDAAVAAARRAHEGGTWRNMSGAERAEVLRAAADLFVEHQEQIVAAEIADSGATMRKGNMADIPGACMAFQAFADQAESFAFETETEEFVPVPSRNIIRYEPIGVVGAVIPFNFPFAAASWKIAPALAAGCPIILKPSPYTPATALLMAEFCTAAGVPAGMVQIVTGPDADIGKALVDHPGVDKVSFTGSTTVGKAVMKSAADTIKNITLELGGKSANIICDDANLDGAIPGSLFGTFFHSGQVCESGTRILVSRTMHDAFVEQLVAGAERITVGPPSDFMTTMGPLISQRQLDNTKRYVALAREEGATVAFGGQVPDHLADDPGYYYAPTILTDVTNDMKVAREEIFGPVVVIIPYEDEDDAVRIANDSQYGLGGAIWSRDTDRALQMARRIETGTIWINDYHMLNPKFEFGGYKMSGIGRELGTEGFKAYLQTKHIHVGEPSGEEEKHYVTMILN